MRCPIPVRPPRPAAPLGRGAGRPPAVKYSPAGQPLYSWRVLILPELGAKWLYDQYKLDEPWDSPHNTKLIAQMPKLYEPTVNLKGVEEGTTFCQVVTGPNTCFNESPRT